MKKKSIIIILVLSATCALLTLKYVGYYTKEDNYIIGFFGRLLNKTNKFEYNIKNVNKSKIDIVWQSEDNTTTLVSNGRTIDNFGYDYGPNKFVVKYNNELECSESFFSENNNETYNVCITIEKKADTVFAIFNFDGEIRVQTLR